MVLKASKQKREKAAEEGEKASFSPRVDTSYFVW